MFMFKSDSAAASLYLCTLLTSNPRISISRASRIFNKHKQTTETNKKNDTF